eukprot:scaffold41939_cov23-Tisochrysis_lutea.AAC.2
MRQRKVAQMRKLSGGVSTSATCSPVSGLASIAAIAEGEGRTRAAAPAEAPNEPGGTRPGSAMISATSPAMRAGLVKRSREEASPRATAPVSAQEPSSTPLDASASAGRPVMAAARAVASACNMGPQSAVGRRGAPFRPKVKSARTSAATQREAATAKLHPLLRNAAAGTAPPGGGQEADRGA